MAESLHIINKEVFEFDCQNSEHAFLIRNKFDYGVQFRISKIIDIACDQLADKNENIRIPLLEIDLGEISFERLEEEIVQVFEKKFYEKLAEKKHYHQDSRQTWLEKEALPVEITTYFLLTGRLPWFAGKQDEDYIGDLFAEVFESSAEAVLRFILLNIGNEKFIERLIAQSGVSHIDQIMQLVEVNEELIAGMENMIGGVVHEILIILKRRIEEANEEFRVQSLSEYNTGHFAEIRKRADNLIEDLVFILKHWNLNTNAEKEFISLLDTAAGYPEEAKRHLVYYIREGPQHPPVLIRKTAVEIVLRMIASKKDISGSDQFLKLFKQVLTEKLELREPIDPSVLSVKLYNKEISEAVHYAKEKLEERRQIESLEDTEAAMEEEGVKFYISNAGLVLIARYLPILFNELKLLDEKKFSNKASQVKAVFLLHYLCTGAEEVPEYILPLNKILCGLNLVDALPSFVLLSQKEKDECKELLNEVIINWEKIGNLSVDGLRESFLNRDGVLVYENNSWKLKLERKGYDVLLESLPWSFTHIKLSWMEDLIITEW
ncbi:MAG: contractile injection system tape measure protein [Flavisolibacter sp.]